jgi:hypothetical protein
VTENSPTAVRCALLFGGFGGADGVWGENSASKLSSEVADSPVSSTGLYRRVAIVLQTMVGRKRWSMLHCVTTENNIVGI